MRGGGTASLLDHCLRRLGSGTASQIRRYLRWRHGQNLDAIPTPSATGGIADVRLRAKIPLPLLFGKGNRNCLARTKNVSLSSQKSES
jgi:hypothetical protein